MLNHPNSQSSPPSPIFVVSVGRSGSTFFHRLLCRHPNVAWLSLLCEAFPGNPSLNRLWMHAVDLPLIGDRLQGLIKPAECYNFWERYCTGFRRPCRDLLPQDVTRKKKEAVRAVMARMLTPKRDRLLIKITGWPRIGFLTETFPNAKFIHILRDGRAVANSYINVPFWWGWRGPENWRWGPLSPSQQEEWETFDKSFLALAGIQWKIFMQAMQKAKRFVKEDSLFELKYETLCQDSVTTFKQVMAFCNLDWSSRFEKVIQNHPMTSTNYKWQKELTWDQQRIVEEVTRQYLEKYDYLRTRDDGKSRR